MIYLLDTSVAVQFRDGDAAVIDKVVALTGPVLISVITRVELEGGVYRDATHQVARRQRLDEMLGVLRTITFGDAEANAYGHIVASAGYSRRKVIDRMTAAQALVASATVVTLNPADFSDVPNLQLLAL